MRRFLSKTYQTEVPRSYIYVPNYRPIDKVILELINCIAQTSRASVPMFIFLNMLVRGFEIFGPRLHQNREKQYIFMTTEKLLYQSARKSKNAWEKNGVF